METRE